MKNLVTIFVVLFAPAFANGTGGVNTNNTDVIQNNIMQGQGYSVSGGGNAQAEGGDAVGIGVGGNSDSDSYSVSSAESNPIAFANISTTANSNYKYRTQPVSTMAPYLPTWTHGGWGTLNAYFPNGPTGDSLIYQRTFDPADPGDMKEIRGVLKSLPYKGPLDVLGGIVNCISVAFGGPDNFHHGRGLKIDNSLVRNRRPYEKALFVLIDSNIDKKLLGEAGYAYIGKINITGDIDLNWDHAYDAVVAEALPWDVDILLISGGMKGVTVGSTVNFPGAAFGYGQANYSVSLFGGMSSGITEGEGKAVISAAAYRYWPTAINKRRIPPSLYYRIQVKPAVQPAAEAAAAATERKLSPMVEEEKTPGIDVSQRLYDLAGFERGQQVQNLNVR